MRSRGFTLVELIATMVILGIISVMTSKFIVNGFSFYVDATNIQKISTTANFVAEKMEKLIENSVPNSIVISETGKSITFVPIKGALGYTYIPKNPLSAFDSKPVLYAVTTAFDSSNIKKDAFVAFNNYGSNEEYYKVLGVTVNGNVTAVKIDAPSSKKFTPGSERGRLYFVDGQNRYITVKLENSQLVIIEHNGNEATGTKNILARDVSDIRFSKVAGAFNQYGEIEIEYRFPYQNIAYEKSIYQRIGVANAP
ncbi:MAG: prepilin-type N-terminal cleavage/methylation domain-containing protein [Succinivibrionaceae bacterium]|nr:prepilin-type N-terminal cleavage/methylation domain-containing protein [Succinivibrionaceae bacterium]